MIKYVAALACLIVAFDCAEKAMGIQTQSLFAVGAEKVWWIAVVSWIASAIGTIVILQERH